MKPCSRPQWDTRWPLLEHFWVHLCGLNEPSSLILVCLIQTLYVKGAVLSLFLLDEAPFPLVSRLSWFHTSITPVCNRPAVSHVSISFCLTWVEKLHVLVQWWSEQEINVEHLLLPFQSLSHLSIQHLCTCLHFARLSHLKHSTDPTSSLRVTCWCEWSL